MCFIVVDCEARGACPSVGRLTEFGAVAYLEKPWPTFHGVLIPRGVATPDSAAYEAQRLPVFELFDGWVQAMAELGGMKRPIMWSDNPAFDWQWINDGFHVTLQRNPFGHSARRIGDFYAGLVGDPKMASKWKGLRQTKHDHHPVHDAMGNLEALDRMLKGERA